MDRNDKMDLIRKYLQQPTEDFFDVAFGDAYEIILYVDWREEDDLIIEYCENILKTNQLSAQLNDTNDEMGFELFINFKDKKTKIHYQGIGADRDTTLKTLNVALQPDFEIRLCKATVNGDTLGFLPLSKKQWTELESEFPEKVSFYFEPISESSVLFG